MLPRLATPALALCGILFTAVVAVDAQSAASVSIDAAAPLHVVRDTFLSTTIDVSLLFHSQQCDLTSPRLVRGLTAASSSYPKFLCRGR